MAKKCLVIVESPTKAKTIRRFLPKHFQVEASMGHIRDLPQKASDIPERFRKEKWANLGVNVADGFEPLYVVPSSKSKVVTKLRSLLKDADELYLATDEDREGESISWHLTEVLKPKVPVKRMVFHEITKSAIEKALTDTRQIDDKLVRAQEARRILDRLFGYTLSPLLWKKIAFGLSAGRVQSVGLRLIAMRERERMSFKKSHYWDLEAELAKSKESFKARLVEWSSKKIATGKDFDEKTGQLRNKEILALGEKEARVLVDTLRGEPFKVLGIEEKPFTTKPAAPFITSTLQQEANRKLGMSSKEAMRTAQKLYEEGFITYMRTDSPGLSQEALQASRKEVVELFGKDYLNPEVRQYTAKAKGAQEAHEAIRPAGSSFVHPKESGLGGKELALYELIWMRTIATQMKEAQKLSVTLKIEAGQAVFSSSGSRIIFPGFLRAYVEGHDDPDRSLEEKEVLFPELKKGDTLDLKKLDALSHETKPPARFTEASLVQILEKEGIGRPSTYASIIETIIQRGYVRKLGNALVPSFTGMAVVQFLEKHFSELVEPSFTSKMEESLDDIAEGKLNWLPYLKSFYSGKEGLEQQVALKEKKIKPADSRIIDLPLNIDAEIKVGRFGAYLEKAASKKGEEAQKASLPEDLAPADLTAESLEELMKAAAEGPKPIGTDPKSGKKVYCLIGRFGPYVQLGEVTEEEPKPRRASLPKGLQMSAVQLIDALKWLSLPRELGVHPDTKKPIMANIGRFGPYVVHDGNFRSLKKDDDVYTVALPRALQLLSEEKVGRGGSKVIKEIGKHPSTNKSITLYEGKYGPYFKTGTKNYTVPKDFKPEDLTLEQALQIMVAKDGSGGKGKRKAS
jgi:DNA topoisomerase-1